MYTLLHVKKKNTCVRCAKMKSHVVWSIYTYTDTFMCTMYAGINIISISTLPPPTSTPPISETMETSPSPTRPTPTIDPSLSPHTVGNTEDEFNLAVQDGDVPVPVREWSPTPSSLPPPLRPHASSTIQCSCSCELLSPLRIIYTYICTSITFTHVCNYVRDLSHL